LITNRNHVGVGFVWWRGGDTDYDALILDLVWVVPLIRNIALWHWW